MKKKKWVLDPMHSEILFKVKHLMITTVTGHFGAFEAEATTEGDNFDRTAGISFIADIHSIYTNNTQRDEHLKSPDFFNADRYPKLKFTAKEYHAANGELKGDLTIRDITKPITFQVEFNGIAKDPMGQVKAGFSLHGKISRKEFGLQWSAVTEAGAVVVGDEVKIIADIQFTNTQAGTEDRGTEIMTEEKINV